MLRTYKSTQYQFNGDWTPRYCSRYAMMISHRLTEKLLTRCILTDMSNEFQSNSLMLYFVVFLQFDLYLNIHSLIATPSINQSLLPIRSHLRRRNKCIAVTVSCHRFSLPSAYADRGDQVRIQRRLSTLSLGYPSGNDLKYKKTRNFKLRTTAQFNFIREIGPVDDNHWVVAN